MREEDAEEASRPRDAVATVGTPSPSRDVAALGTGNDIGAARVSMSTKGSRVSKTQRREKDAL
jgi:hypothetical protein